MMDSYQAAEFQYRVAQILEAQIVMEGMKAENEIRKIRGEAPAYGEEQFQKIIIEHDIHHNGSVSAGLRIKNGG